MTEQTETKLKEQKRTFSRRTRGCPLSGEGAPAIDYKNPTMLVKYISDMGRVLPARITGICPKKQRQLKVAIKRARHLAFLPFKKEV